MALGVLDASHSENVPGKQYGTLDHDLTKPSIGTSFVYDDASRPVQDGELDSRLKYDRSGSVPIILVPQPSDDPNDPLVRSFSPRNLFFIMESTIRILIAYRIGHYGSATLSSSSFQSYPSLPRLSALCSLQTQSPYPCCSREISHKWHSLLDIIC